VFAETLAARNSHPNATCADYNDYFNLHPFSPMDRHPFAPLRRVQHF
jgi:hypothetical protein